MIARGVLHILQRKPMMTVCENAHRGFIKSGSAKTFLWKNSTATAVELTKFLNCARIVLSESAVFRKVFLPADRVQSTHVPH